MSQFQSSKLTRLCSRKPVSMMSFSVAAAAFSAALVGAILNYYLAEVMAVLGMIMVGLFYLAMGIWYSATHETGPAEPEEHIPLADGPPAESEMIDDLTETGEFGFIPLFPVPREQRRQPVSTR